MEIVKPNTITLLRVRYNFQLREVSEFFKAFMPHRLENPGKREVTKYINSLSFDDIKRGIIIYIKSSATVGIINLKNGMTMNNIQTFNVTQDYNKDVVSIVRKKYTIDDLNALSRSIKVKRLKTKINLDPILEEKVNSIYDEFDININRVDAYSKKRIRNMALSFIKERR